MSNARTERAARLMAAPILPTLLRLSAPGLILVAFQSAVSIGDTWLVGRLGTAPLAGLALVFPLLMLLQMTSAGAMGGGVSSAVARALGAGDTATARRLVVHALAIAAVMGLAFTALVLGFGAPIYRLLGGRGETLELALSYSTIVFSGALVVWVSNTFASLLRGTGNTLLPAIVLVSAAAIHLPLSACLVLGLGPAPRLGIAGAAIAYVSTFSISATALGIAVLNRGSLLRPHRSDWALQPRLFREILRVGGISLVSSLQTVLTAVLLTGFVGHFGAAALAGYGVGVRLELLQVPLVFAIGQAMVALVGLNIGADNVARARRIAWTGTALAACVSLSIGLTAAFLPHAWVGLFSSDAQVLEAGSRYLQTVGPAYPFLAAGIALYFASQGAGQVALPVLAGTVRLGFVVIGASVVFAYGGELPGLFTVIALGMTIFGVLTIAAVLRTRWCSSA